MDSSRIALGTLLVLASISSLRDSAFAGDSLPAVPARAGLSYRLIEGQELVYVVERRIRMHDLSLGMRGAQSIVAEIASRVIAVDAEGAADVALRIARLRAEFAFGIMGFQYDSGAADQPRLPAPWGELLASLTKGEYRFRIGRKGPIGDVKLPEEVSKRLREAKSSFLEFGFALTESGLSHLVTQPFPVLPETLPDVGEGWNQEVTVGALKHVYTFALEGLAGAAEPHRISVSLTRIPQRDSESTTFRQQTSQGSLRFLHGADGGHLLCLQLDHRMLSETLRKLPTGEELPPLRIQFDETAEVRVPGSDVQCAKPREHEGGPAPQPPPLEDCLEFAREFEACFDRRDFEFLDRKLDLERFLDLAIGAAPGSAELKDQFRAGCASSMGIGEGIWNRLQKDAGFDLLRVRDADGHRRLLFRLALPPGKVGYYEFQVERDGKGGLRIEDVVLYQSGFGLREAALFVYLRMLKGRWAKEEDTKTLDPEQDVWNRLGLLYERFREGRAAEALKILDGLPPALARTRSLRLLRVELSSGSSEAAYDEAVEAFRAAFPSDPAADLISVGRLVDAKRFDAALACLDRVDEKLGGDPYLGLLRSSALIEAGSPQKAKEALRRALKEDPRIEGEWSHWLLVTIALLEKDHVGTASLLTAMEERFGTMIGDLEKLEPYADFVQSAEYERWLKRRQDRPSAPSPEPEG